LVIGNIIGGINQRRGTIVDTEVRDEEFTLRAEVSLNDMFGYSTALRGCTQGKGRQLFTKIVHGTYCDLALTGEFSMEYKVCIFIELTKLYS